MSRSKSLLPSTAAGRDKTRKTHSFLPRRLCSIYLRNNWLYQHFRGNIHSQQNKRRYTIMWKEGSIRVNGEVFHYWMKQYDKGSEWGIDGGRISKLMLKRDGKIVCNYDRGWDIEPADENTQLATELLLHSENW
nr:MAG TPA: hypothetical protein [Bacteriophage sp.]